MKNLLITDELYSNHFVYGYHFEQMNTASCHWPTLPKKTETFSKTKQKLIPRALSSHTVVREYFTLQVRTRRRALIPKRVVKCAYFAKGKASTQRAARFPAAPREGL